MATATWTQKQVVDLLPKYLGKRLAGHRPRAEAMAGEVDIAVTALTHLINAPRIAVDGVVTIDRQRWRAPYATKDLWTATWEQLVEHGLAERSGAGWRITAAGAGLGERLTRDIRAHLESLRLAPVELRRATAALTGLAAKIPSDSGRAIGTRRGMLLRDEIRSDIVRLDVAIMELWNRRDDCHIAAWQRAGYAGPALDVLSQVWEGKTTLDDVAWALEAKQERADVERNVDEVAFRGDIARDGATLALTAQGKKRRDEIEQETDRRYFAGWPTGADLSRLGDDLTALIDALP